MNVSTLRIKGESLGFPTEKTNHSQGVGLGGREESASSEFKIPFLLESVIQSYSSQPKLPERGKLKKQTNEKKHTRKKDQ